jgi:hypothetical protein
MTPPARTWTLPFGSACLNPQCVNITKRRTNRWRPVHASAACPAADSNTPDRVFDGLLTAPMAAVVPYQ